MQAITFWQAVTVDQTNLLELLETYPHLREQVPPEILARLI